MVTGIDAGLDVRGLDGAARARIVAALPPGPVADQVTAGGFVHSDDVAALDTVAFMNLLSAVAVELPSGRARSEFRAYMGRVSRS